MRAFLATILVLMAACSGAATKVKTPDATSGPTVMEMCAEFRNHICVVVSGCGLEDMDSCTSKLDSRCEEVKSVSDPKKLFAECLPQIDQVMCSNFELPPSCNGMFN